MRRRCPASVARAARVALGACLLSGCLIPFPIEEQPPEINYPPYYAEGTVSPSPDRWHEYDPLADGPVVVFDVGVVDDPNLGDVLFYRWFVDFSAEGGGLTALGELGPSERGEIRFEYPPCFERRVGGEVEHRIDLVVSDRPFLEGSATQAVPDDAGVLHLTWFIRLDDRLCDQ